MTKYDLKTYNAGSQTIKNNLHNNPRVAHGPGLRETPGPGVGTPGPVANGRSGSDETEHDGLSPPAHAPEVEPHTVAESRTGCSLGDSLPMTADVPGARNGK